MPFLKPTRIADQETGPLVAFKTEGCSVLLNPAEHGCMQ